MYLQKGHHTVKSIRQRETIPFKPQRYLYGTMLSANSRKFESASAK